MLVDRNLIVDLIDLEFKRENEYRHPHCIIVILAFRGKKKRACRGLYEEHSMYRY
jgi:hypothetical protein